MRSPDVAQAVSRLENERVLTPQQANLFGRVARGELVSLSPAIDILLYLGVVTTTTGVSILVKDHLTSLGPLTIGGAIAVASTLCLTWVFLVSPRYSRVAAPSPHFAFDSILMLGALLFAADLAYIETKFETLGPNWAWHLLIVSVFHAMLAFRFDSRALFSLSLTTFAAWRGVSATSVERSLHLWSNDADTVRLNAFLCGVLFVALGRLLLAQEVKAHFEPVSVHLGWALILLSIAGGIDHEAWDVKAAHRAALIAFGGGLAWLAWNGRRFGLFVFGVLASYLGVTAIVLDWWNSLSLPSWRTRELGNMAFLAVSCALIVIGLVFLHRRFPREEEE